MSKNMNTNYNSNNVLKLFYYVLIFVAIKIWIIYYSQSRKVPTWSYNIKSDQKISLTSIHCKDSDPIVWNDYLGAKYFEDR